ncbi:vWA domain-containing protein [Halomonas elongata]|uniref:vWA domain-containing protein n=1 Tax=Halomonas elongata TaxID=2746 RepID=UPI0023AFBAB0|nr:VWA domain-containing protein [Halomonas elongata]
MKKIALRAAALALAGGMAFATPVNATNENVMIVFDGSNSMWGQIDGTAKIEIARNVMENLLGEWTETRKVGLMAYGHRRRGDCTDMETIVVPSEGSRAEILDRIGTITPTGKTPLTSAVEQAATELSYTDTPATVVLISDGLESCERDPCALAETLEKGGVGFTAHVVGFGLGDADTGALSCLAENTDGQYIEAGNAEELGRALSAVATAVSEPEPEPEPERPEVIVSGPESALAGSLVRIGWDKALDKRDYVTIVPTGTEAGDYGNYIRVKDRTEGDLRAPADTGMHELRYMTSEGGEVLGTAMIEITEPEVTVSGPKTALAGERFPVEWTGAVDGEDYITIVPMGAEEGSYTNYFRVRDESEEKLQAPAATGLYELRYVLKEGGRTMARQPIEITEPEVTVSGPDEVRAGTRIPVQWSGAVDGEDYITIVPMGAEEGSYTEYFRVRDESTKTLQAPENTGLYELRYVLKEGGRTMARHMIEVLAADAALESGASLSAPETAEPGAIIEVGWNVKSGSADQRITLARGNQAIFTWLEAVKISGKPPVQIPLPEEPGMYELRFLDVANREVLSRKVIKVE